MRAPLLFLACFLSAGLLAETTPEKRYYTEVNSPFFIGGSLQLPGSGFTFTPRTGNSLGIDTSLRFRPATQLLYGISARYKILGGGLTFTLPVFGFQAAEGKSTYQDYRINFYTRTWGFELNYSNWSGYLIDGVRGLAGETYYLLPDLKNIGSGLVFYIPLSPDSYSLGASFDQRDRQLSSASSFFIVAGFRYQSLRNPGAILPVSKQADFGNDATLSRSTMKSVTAGIGYGVHLVAADFFFAPAIIVEGGFQSTEYILAAGPQDYSFVGLNGRVRMSIGHNGKTLITGVRAYVDGFTESTRDTVILNVSYAAEVFLGFRL